MQWQQLTDDEDDSKDYEGSALPLKVLTIQGPSQPVRTQQVPQTSDGTNVIDERFSGDIPDRPVSLIQDSAHDTSDVTDVGASDQERLETTLLHGFPTDGLVTHGYISEKENEADSPFINTDTKTTPANTSRGMHISNGRDNTRGSEVTNFFEHSCWFIPSFANGTSDGGVEPRKVAVGIEPHFKSGIEPLRGPGSILPRLLRVPTKLEFVSGQRAVLECISNVGSPHAVIAWTKTGKWAPFHLRNNNYPSLISSIVLTTSVINEHPVASWL